MLWEVEILPKDRDPERERVCEEYDLLTHRHIGPTTLARTARGYLLEGDCRASTATAGGELLVDPLVETIDSCRRTAMRIGAVLLGSQ